MEPGPSDKGLLAEAWAHAARVADGQARAGRQDRPCAPDGVAVKAPARVALAAAVRAAVRAEVRAGAGVGRKGRINQ